MVGGFTWKKNLEYGVELFRRFLEIEPAARLFIVGYGQLPEQKRRYLFSLGDAVFTVESEAPGKMERWYESCPMLLFPSRYEGGRPFTILEAQSRGCIVFATDIASTRECIISGVTGFFLAGVNPVADVNLIETTYRNPDVMHTIGKNAWRKAMRNRSQRQGKRCARILLMNMTGRKK
jgi:glycosyltransferase involved in cell wall biosynthesis